MLRRKFSAKRLSTKIRVVSQPGLTPSMSDTSEQLQGQTCRARTESPLSLSAFTSTQTPRPHRQDSLEEDVPFRKGRPSRCPMSTPAFTLT